MYAILAYIGPLIVIPLLAARGSRFVRFHLKQGGLLFALWILVELALRVLSGVLAAIPLIGWLFIFALSVIRYIPIALMIVGIINVCTGKARKLPIIGDLIK